MAGPGQSPAQLSRYDESLRQGVPPDPREVGDLCREVDHSGLFSLAMRDGQAVLRHVVTGESHAFRQGQSVALHVHRKRAFVEADGETIWVNKLLKRSLFECVSDARQFVFAKRDDGFQCTWVSELQQRHVDGSISLTIGLVPPRMAVVSYMAFLAGRPQGPGRVFWNLRSFQSAMQLQGLSTRQAQSWIREGMARTWSSMLLKSECADCDQLACYSGQVEHDASGLSATTMHTSVSTRALLHLMSHWSRTLTMEADRASAIAVFGALVLGVCGCNC